MYADVGRGDETRLRKFITKGEITVKKFDRKIAIILAAALACTMTGCKKKESGKQTDNGKMTVTIANSVAINDDTPVEKYLEEKYNIEIKAKGFATSYYDKLATMFASKDIPDAMLINDISNWEPLANQGVISPLDINIIKEAAPDHYKHINEKNEKLWELGKKNGKLYAIPKTMGDEYNTIVLWNNNWLKNVGINKIPETLDEFEYAFDKIKNEDPDGNGRQDTYPISGIGGNYYRQFDWVFGAYGIMPEQWTIEDGKVINGTVTEKAREALVKLNEWYDKGYINPEFLTDNQSTIAKRFDQQGIALNTTNLENVSELTPHGKANLKNAGEEYANRIAYGPLPEGPNGDRGDWLWGPLSNFVCFGRQMEKDVEKQKVILKMLNDLNYDEETALMGAYGIYGESYEFYDNKVGKSSGIKQLENYGADANANAKMGIGFFNLLKCGTWADKSIADLYQNPKYIQEQEKYAKWDNYHDELMRASLPSMLTYATTLQTLKTNAYSEFISGKRSLDKWEDFVKEYMNAGGSVLQKEAQEYYDSIIK